MLSATVPVWASTNTSWSSASPPRALDLDLPHERRLVRAGAAEQPRVVDPRARGCRRRAARRRRRSPFAIAAMAVSRAAEELSRGEVSTFGVRRVSRRSTDSRLRCASRLTTSSPADHGDAAVRPAGSGPLSGAEPPRADSTRSSRAWSREPERVGVPAPGTRARHQRAGLRRTRRSGRAMRLAGGGADEADGAGLASAGRPCTPEPRSRRSAAARCSRRPPGRR